MVFPGVLLFTSKAQTLKTDAQTASKSINYFRRAEIFVHYFKCQDYIKNPLNQKNLLNKKTVELICPLNQGNPLYQGPLYQVSTVHQGWITKKNVIHKSTFFETFPRLYTNGHVISHS